MTNAIAEIRTSPNARADGVFDPILLGDLITWAAYDQETIDLDDYMREHFEGWGTWDQGVWARKDVETPKCGTAFCMAGQAVAQAGFVMVSESDDEGEVPVDTLDSFEYCAPVVGVERDASNRVVAHLYDPARVSTISSTGRRVLGLDDREADFFFDGDNDLGTLITLADWFCRRRGHALPVKTEVLERAHATFDQAAWDNLENGDGYPWDDDEDDSL